MCMASDTIVPEEAKEKPPCKVYTRRFRNKKNASSNNNSSATPTASIAGEVSATIVTNNNENGTVDKDEANDINNDAQIREVEDANSNHQRPNSPIIEVISGDRLSLDQNEDPVLNDRDENAVNEAISARPVIERIDNDKVRINFSTAMLEHERKELKRKLVSELEEVKELAKKLKYKEDQLIRYIDEFSTGNGFSTGVNNGPVHSQYSTSDGLGNENGLRVFSDVGSVGYYDSRPYQHLSVSDIGNTNHFVKRAPKANRYYSSEFISGTDKLPVIESNKKKTKTNGRKKQGKASSVEKQVLKKCATLLNKIMKHHYAWVFNTPVDVKRMGLHDYYIVIKHPMDLGTVKTRLTKNWYKSPMEFAEDVRLTFHNAMTYNPAGQDVHTMAVELLNMFEENWVQLEADYSSKLRFELAYDVALPTYVPPPPVYQETRQVYMDRSESFALPVESTQKPPVTRTVSMKKPKARDLNKRDMTFDEKKKLGDILEDFPIDKLDSVVQIIKKRSSALSQHDNEIEVEIDSLDTETLWELDRFVTNYKKNMSKRKRKAELASLRAEAQQEIHVTNPVVSTAEMPKETKADDTNATFGSAPVLGRKEADDIPRTSSSSSSDSGSSSSDSDSDSSSGSKGG